MDPDDVPATPRIDPAIFDRVQAKLTADGPLAAVDQLIADLATAEDFQNLFYAMLMRKRVELGLAPFPTGSSQDLPPEAHEPYETAIRQAGRTVGQMLLDRGDIPRAWTFFRMLGEPEPVKQALRDYAPGPDADPYPIIDIAWQQGLMPEKGFDLVIGRHGVCSAITMVHSSDLAQNPTLRDYCTKKLVRALHEQLTERLRSDLQSHAVSVPVNASVPELLLAGKELFGEDTYHIDVSHLSSVVQLALQLPPCEEIALAQDLCRYGEKLSPGLRGDSDPPFENTYADYLQYLNVVADTDREAGLAHFRAKLPQAAVDGYIFPAEVTVNLLVKIGRVSEALVVAREYLPVSDGQLNCPGVTELARRAEDYEAVARVARSAADPVNFLAGLIAARR